MIKVAKRKITYLYFHTLNYLLMRSKWIFYKEDLRTCRVYYGYDSLPARSEKVSGGIVKCQDLQHDFQNIVKNSNLLYLVSSALPPFADLLVKRAKAKGIKIIWNQNGVAYPAWHGPGWEETNKPLGEMLHLADYVIYQSEFCKRSADHYLGGFKGSSTILHNPVNANVFVPADEQPLGYRLLVAGTHNEQYRIRIALEIFSRVLTFLPEAELTIAGPLRWRNEQNSAIEEVAKMAKSEGVEGKVTLLGAYSQDDAISIFQSHHILLHTQYNDACPRLVVEAMSCGLPVVYSSSGGTPELVGSQGGIGVEVLASWEKIYLPDVDKMAEAVKKVFEDYLSYSKNARVRAKSQFDVRKWVSSHKVIFEDLLKMPR